MKYMFLLMLGFVQSLSAQETNAIKHDSNYYKIYPQGITARFYFSQKFTTFKLGTHSPNHSFTYLPNTTLNMGIGATYRQFSLNLAYGFGFFNQDKDKGKTKYLDLQSHSYHRNWVVDLFGQFYKGYYLHKKDFEGKLNTPYYVRPDMRVRLAGAAITKILNGRKFSYRSTFTQSEWQQKSAGSLLLSADIYYGAIKGDSAFVPAVLNTSYPQRDVQKLHFAAIGPGIGYGYQLVVKKHFFISASATVNARIGFVKEFAPAVQEDRFFVYPHYNYRLGIGYNSDQWIVIATFVNRNVAFNSSYTSSTYVIAVGNPRINIAKRLVPGKKLKQKLKWIDPYLKG